MPRKECKPMDERLRLIARLLESEEVASLCREFGIARVTCWDMPMIPVRSLRGHWLRVLRTAPCPVATSLESHIFQARSLISLFSPLHYQHSSPANSR